MKTKKILLTTILLCFVLVSYSFAQTAKVKSVTGKVEYSTDGTSWSAVKENMSLAKGTIISTSFKSTAVIVINDSLLHVKPLTRMSLDELRKTQDEVQTELNLVSGKVQVEVKPRAKQEVVNFTVKSAVATASVRGTGFVFDGRNLFVNHGNVALQSNTGFTRSVLGGEFSQVSSRGKVSTPSYVTKATDSVFESDDEAEEEGDVSDGVLASFTALADEINLNALVQSFEAASVAQGVRDPEAIMPTAVNLSISIE
ncbi:MAG TPA: FecR domain-containing protein [Treponemataceae bacterium]|nr:FecR domain-containing protein [Treponemataceae bacterium]